MGKTTFLLLFGMFAASCSFLAGCSARPSEGGDYPRAWRELSQVNNLLYRVAGALGRPPASLDDLDRYRNDFPGGYEAVKSGNIVVLWGTPLKGEGEIGQNETVLAYEKAVPTEGGYVLLSAGTIKKMTAAEFQAAPKAK